MANIYRPRKSTEIAEGYNLRYTARGATWLTFKASETVSNKYEECVYGNKISVDSAFEMAKNIEKHLDDLNLTPEEQQKKESTPINTRITIFDGNIAVGFVVKSSTTTSNGEHRMIPAFGPKQLKALAREIRLAARTAGDFYLLEAN
jgi:hypothetical protein